VGVGTQERLILALALDWCSRLGSNPSTPTKPFEEIMLKYIWLFCLLYPSVYIWFAPNIWWALLSFFIILAWDVTNNLENAEPDPYE